MIKNFEETISNLVKNQFPEFYREEGPVFVDFVTKYFKWLETSQPIANSSYSEAKQFCKIKVEAGNTAITGVADNIVVPTFTRCFSDGTKIAIYTKDDGSDYNIYTVNNVVSDTLLYLTEAPDFSQTKTRFSIVKDQKNPVQYLRHFYDDLDVDETSEEFLVYFKEKYLKNINFTTDVDIRRLVKHSLDIYRSKGTERGADLLFKMVYGVPAKFYYPGDDLFRLSDGQWSIPRYLEVQLKDTNRKLKNKQIFGYTSGATAFVESVVRKTVNGRLVDVLYISGISGIFDTGEIINSSDYVLEKEERPTIIGSLTAIEITNPRNQHGFEVGDILDVSGPIGRSAKARVTETSNSVGTVDFNLDEGGYGYTLDSEVIVSNNVITVSEIEFPNTAVGINYFETFADLKQPMANVKYTNNNNDFTNGEIIYTYHGNGDVRGEGILLSANDNYLLISVNTIAEVNNFNDSRIYSESNTVNADITLYQNQTAHANVFGMRDVVIVNVSNSTGSYVLAEEVYQNNPATNELVAQAVVEKYEAGDLGVGVLTMNHIEGAFRTAWPVVGRISNTSSIIGTQTLRLGVKDVLETLNANNGNYVYVGNGSISGKITSITTGNDANFSVAELDDQETINVNSDFLIDYYTYPLELDVYTGTVSINTSSKTVTGTGTDFINEIGNTSLSGVAYFNSSSNSVVGDSTQFLTEVSVNDILRIGNSTVNQDIRVRSIVNNTFLWCNSAATANLNDFPITKNPYIIFDDGTSRETHQVDTVINATSLTLDTQPSYTNSNVTIKKSWAFMGNTSGNAINEDLDTMLSRESVQIGKIERIANINPGQDYNDVPVVTVYEKYTYPYQRKDKLVKVSETSGSYSVNEVINQSSSNARGKYFYTATGNKLYLQELRLYSNNNFEVTTNSSQQIEGSLTDTTSNVTSVEQYKFSKYSGFNANILANTISAAGEIVSVEVIESGFGFTNGAQVTLTSSINNEIYGIGTTGLGIGKGAGFYKRKNGFLSENSKILDAYYYQDFSYELRSPIALAEYEKMLKQLIHVAGTKYFGALVYDSIANVNVRVKESVFTQTTLFETSDIESNTEAANTITTVLMSANEVTTNTEVDEGNAEIYSVFTANDISSNTEINNFEYTGYYVLDANTLDTNTEVSNTVLTNRLSASSIESQINLEFPSITILVTANELTSNTNLDTPSLAVSMFTDADLSSNTNLDTPAITENYYFGVPFTVQVSTSVGSPALSEN